MTWPAPPSPAAAAPSLRVGVVGARRVRQGTGPFLARAFHRLGCAVTGVAGRTAESAAAAAADLEAAYGIRARPYAGAAALLAAEPLDVLVIASPAEEHEGDLERALAAGCHVLCEKPLLWSADGVACALDPARAAARVAAARALGERFAARDRLLAVNEQWPWALPAFDALHPGRARPPRAFAMRLSPMDGGLPMVVESASHPVSLLEAVAGPGRVEDAEALWHADRSAVTIGFGWRLLAPPAAAGIASGGASSGGASGGGASGPERHASCRGTEAASALVLAALELARVPAQPRPAWVQIDDRRAERALRLADYAMELRDGARAVPLPDPLDARVASFVAAVRALGGAGGASAMAAAATDPGALARGVEGLLALVGAAARDLG